MTDSKPPRQRKTKEELCPRALGGGHVPKQTTIGYVCSACSKYLGPVKMTPAQRARMQASILRRFTDTPGATLYEIEHHHGAEGRLIFKQLLERGEIAIVPDIWRSINGERHAVYHAVEQIHPEQRPLI